MPTSKKPRFSVGDAVYARFFGDTLLTIKSVSNVKAVFPHYICASAGEYYLLPCIHLSSRPLIAETNDGNRRQLPLPIAFA
jgi:hypothetical protein